VARLIDAPVADEHEIEPFTREEARRILDAAKGHRNAARWSVALVLGIRQGEALGLRWSIEQGVHVRVVQEILGHARVTTTERYTHVASPRSATRVPSSARRSGGSNETRYAATRSNTLSSDRVTGEGAGRAEARGFEPRMDE
jgi:Phage integrase family